MRLFTTTLLVGALVGAAMTTFPATADAQNQGRPRMPTMLGDDDPNVGDMLPDVELFDADGHPIRLHSLDGKYKVIVFGCLT